MKSYLNSVFSFKKISYPCVSIFAAWDRKSTFTQKSEIRRFSKLKESNIGRYSRVNPFCKLAYTSVGNFTAIGSNSEIGLGRHPMNYVSSQNIFYKRNKMDNRWVKPIDYPPLPIEIGNDVWIGVHSTILDGVKIGNGAVIGARSVVTKDVPPYAIAVGVPAKVIKFRFSDEIIQRLEEVQWWNLSEGEIDERIDFFRNPEVSIEMINRFFPQDK